MAEEVAKPDLVAARIAARQYGVISIRQLRKAGLSDDAVLGRVRAGRLHRIHRGIYAVGHFGLGIEGKWMAAVLACGNGAALSHRTAAALWGLLPPIDGPMDVVVASNSGRAKRTGIRVHRRLSLRPADLTRHRGISTTTPARTVGDLRRVVPERLHRRAIRQADVLGLPLGSEVMVDRTRSELEYLFLRLCRRYRFPVPEVNVQLGSLLADFVWREQRLVVETNGYRYHRGRAAFEEDHGRDLHFRTLGYEVIRLSYRQVVNEPKLVAEVLTAALAE